MTYSDETMRRMEASIENAGNALLGVGATAEHVAEVMSNLPPEITHRTMCGGDSCFVPWCSCDCHTKRDDVALVR